MLHAHGDGAQLIFGFRPHDPRAEVYTFIQRRELPLIEAAYEEMWLGREKKLTYDAIHRANYLVHLYGFATLAWEKVLKALRRGARSELDQARYAQVVQMISDCARTVETKWAARNNWPTIVQLGDVEFHRPVARCCRRIRRYARCWIVMRRCVDAWRTHQQYRPGGVGWAVTKEHFEDMVDGAVSA